MSKSFRKSFASELRACYCCFKVSLYQLWSFKACSCLSRTIFKAITKYERPKIKRDVCQKCSLRLPFCWTSLIIFGSSYFVERDYIFLQASLFIFGRSYFLRALFNLEPKLQQINFLWSYKTILIKRQYDHSLHSLLPLS